jgi:hypothetical protein
LFRLTEEITIQGFNNYINLYNNEIVQLIYEDTKFLKDLIELFWKDETKKCEVIIFFDEYLNLFKNTQNTIKSNSFKALVQVGLMELIQNVLLMDKNTNFEIKKRNLNIIYHIILHDGVILREEILKKTNFLKNLLKSFTINNDDSGFLDQLTEIIKILFNSEIIIYKKDEILNILYEDGNFDSLLQVLDQKDKNINTKNYLCLILSFFIQIHTHRIRTFILKNNLIEKVLNLLNNNDKILQLNVLKFFKNIISQNDIFYNSEIIKSNSFKKIFELWNTIENKYNLICSTILDILDNFILKKKINKLLTHLNDKFYTIIEKEKKTVTTFNSLIDYFEKNKYTDIEKNDENEKTDESFDEDKDLINEKEEEYLLKEDRFEFHDSLSPNFSENISTKETFDITSLNFLKKKNPELDNDDEFVLATSQKDTNTNNSPISPLKRNREIFLDEDFEHEEKRQKIE